MRAVRVHSPLARQLGGLLLWLLTLRLSAGLFLMNRLVVAIEFFLSLEFDGTFWARERLVFGHYGVTSFHFDAIIF